jgi:ATP-dependent Clp protease ATP-binding subunit ClpA
MLRKDFADIHGSAGRRIKKETSFLIAPERSLGSSYRRANPGDRHDNQYIGLVHICILIALLRQGKRSMHSFLRNASVSIGSLTNTLESALECLPKMTGVGHVNRMVASRLRR